MIFKRVKINPSINNDGPHKFRLETIDDTEHPTDIRIFIPKCQVRKKIFFINNNVIFNLKLNKYNIEIHFSINLLKLI